MTIWREGEDVRIKSAKGLPTDRGTVLGDDLATKRVIVKLSQPEGRPRYARADPSDLQAIAPPHTTAHSPSARSEICFT